MSWTKRSSTPPGHGHRRPGQRGRPRRRREGEADQPGNEADRAEPLTLLEEQYPIGSVHRGQVRNVTDFGIFVGVQEGIDASCT